MNFKHLETTFEEIEVEDLEKVKGGRIWGESWSRINRFLNF